MSDNEPLRILMLIPELGYGGAESDFARLAQYLSTRANVSIAVMATSYGNASYSKDRPALDLPVVVLDNCKAPAGSAVSKVARWWRMLRKLRQLKRDADVTISFLSGANLLNALTGGRRRTIVSERGSKRYHTGISPGKKLLWLGLLDPLIYRLCAKIVAVSQDYASEVSEVAWKSDRPKIVAIEGLIEARKLIYASQSEPDKDIAAFCAHPTLVFAGRLDRGKGLELLIPAIADLKCKFPQVRLLVIGEGPQLPSIMRLCQQANLATTRKGDPLADIFFCGYRKDPIRHYRLARAFLFPSLHEGLPNVLIEAVASGVPILASDCNWGPRSILSGMRSSVGKTGAGAISNRLAYGTLMPLPNTQSGLMAWREEMENALALPVSFRDLADCRQAIDRFDIQKTGAEWFRLVEALAVRP